MALRLRFNIPKTGFISYFCRNDRRFKFISCLLILLSYYLIRAHVTHAYTNTYTNTFTNALTCALTFTFTFRYIDTHTNIHTYTRRYIHVESEGYEAALLLRDCVLLWEFIRRAHLTRIHGDGDPMVQVNIQEQETRYAELRQGE